MLTIVISKPNKTSYNSPKFFRLIVLLNTLWKLIKKVISNRLQFHIIFNNFIYQSQLEDLKFKLTTDTGIVLTHFIHIKWIKNMLTNSLAFDIMQFFPLLNHYLLALILGKAGFNSQVVKFFSNYLVNRKTKYFWNNFSSSIVNINVGVDQRSALSPIFLALYLALFLYILEKHLKNLDLKISILSFVDDSLLITQSKSFQTSNAHLFSSYNVAFNLFFKFGLLVKHLKTKVFYFFRLQGVFSLLLLDLLPLGSPILYSKDSWRYLGFIFNRKLLFHQHINFYANKVISTVKCMKILGNSTRGLNPQQKQLLYRSYALPIALYRFQMWYYNKAPLSYPLKALGKLQRRATL